MAQATPSTAKWRFFFHYRRCDGRMSVHFRDRCIPCRDVVCRAPVNTKRNRRQPYLVMQGFASSVRYDPRNDIVTIK